MAANAGAQIINAQINRAQLAKAVQALLGRLVHMARANRRHHRQGAHPIQSGTDDAAVDTVVGVVADQLGLHINAPLDVLGL